MAPAVERGQSLPEGAPCLDPDMCTEFRNFRSKSCRIPQCHDASPVFTVSRPPTHHVLTGARTAKPLQEWSCQGQISRIEARRVHVCLGELPKPVNASSQTINIARSAVSTASG